MAVQIRLFGVKCGRNLFFPLALLLKPNVTEKKYKNTFFLNFIYINYFQITFVRRMLIAIESA